MAKLGCFPNICISCDRMIQNGEQVLFVKWAEVTNENAYGQYPYAGQLRPVFKSGEKPRGFICAQCVWRIFEPLERETQTFKSLEKEANDILSLESLKRVIKDSL